ncbi:hypothetical protein KVT40_003616 [Elsinoe batatas]|uniref:Uncharacterized protein n=1 Tax=Elsinoe batatas TaxID=2601811 RepID=A0A8K0L8N0_9PEZI|nr:hypothetical protein KVT40_003616 [Elsinoe batatas]
MLPNTSHHLPFRGLPPELRHQIYTHLLVHPHPLILTERPASTPTTFLDTTGAQPVHLSSHTPAPYLPLLLLARSERTTISTLFLGENTFRLSTSCASAVHFLSNLPPATRLGMRRVSIASKALYYYDTANRPFRALFRLLAEEMALKSVELCTYEGQNGLIDAVFREAARGVYEGLVRQMRVRYEIAPAYGVEGGENVLAGRVVWDEWEEGFRGRYEGLEEGGRRMGYREGERRDGGDGGEVVNTPMLSPYWTRFFGGHQRRSELVKEGRALCPFQLFVEHVEEFGERNVVLVLKEVERRVLEERIDAIEDKARLVQQVSGEESVTAPVLLEKVDRARRTLESLDKRKVKVAEMKRNLFTQAGIHSAGL